MFSANYMWCLFIYPQGCICRRLALGWNTLLLWRVCFHRCLSVHRGVSTSGREVVAEISPGQTAPLGSACWDTSTSRWYASHWNAFFFFEMFPSGDTVNGRPNKGSTVTRFWTTSFSNSYTASPDSGSQPNCRNWSKLEDKIMLNLKRLIN